MPTREDFNAQVKQAIAGRLDPDYVEVKLSGADFDSFGNDAQRLADHLVQSAPKALRTAPSYDPVAEGKRMAAQKKPDPLAFQ